MLHKENQNHRSIIELPKLVADKIAAGEVVDRPLSVVKELLENAIDAGSTSIAVEIKNGGKTYIRVTDNGQGIPKEEAELAFKRHATSKIRESEDLDHITTLGFRGEALSSIAAVSRVELITKTAQSKTGISIKIDGGILVDKSEIGCPDGTTVIVSDLFFNTPARHKFMKPDNTESTLIIDFVSKMALAYSNIKIRLKNNGNILFSTNGKNDIYGNIQTIYSRQWGEELISFDMAQDNSELSLQNSQHLPGQYHIKGYISKPQNTKSNKKSQIFFVNGRYIQSKVLEQAVATAYAEKTFEGRYPAAFLFLTVNPELLDVNIHPNKREVRFAYEKDVKDFVVSCISQALGQKKAISDIQQKNIFTFAQIQGDKEVEKLEKPRETQKEIDVNLLLSTQNTDLEFEKIEKFKKYANEQKNNNCKTDKNISTKSDNNCNSLNNVPSYNYNICKHLELELGVGVGETKLEYSVNNNKDNSYNVQSNDKLTNDIDEFQNYNIASNNEKVGKNSDSHINNLKDNDKSLELIEEIASNSDLYDKAFNNYIKPSEAFNKIELNKQFDISKITILSNIFSTYIIGADGDSLYLIDQHAAHERIFYELLKKQLAEEEQLPQSIMIPLRKEVSYSLKNHLEDWLGFLRSLGFEIEEFGVKTYIIKGIPHFMNLSEAESFFDDFTDNISDDMDFTDQKRMDKIISKACKNAVKAHDSLHQKEMEALLEQLEGCENPYSCPHGRPIFIKLNKKEIEKMFKRI